MLEVRNLHVKYGNIEALQGVSFQVKEGEMVALLGANGAGKSTTLMSIMRLPPPEGPLVTGGSITYNGVNLLSAPPHEVVAVHGIGLVPEGRHIFGNLTVLENLKIATYARKDTEQIARDYDRVFTLFPRLADRKHQRGDTLSGGEQQMLAMGRAFMSGVRFILLDEPSMGLAPL
ncbi:MAG: ABC transporter ATP-binding protein, partial [Deltaproteobacteria bacterium]|nr:ABC transporter ATP-binding protein [Deltaproteobacteria bacterium]